MRPIYVCGLAATLLLSSCTSAHPDLAQARQSLKDYGLARCILAAMPQASDMYSDFSAASHALHFMGRGFHQIKQDEDTLEVTHDPYQLIDTFVRQAYPESLTHTKAKGENVFLSCLAVYHLEEYDRLVRAQDDHIDLTR